MGWLDFITGRSRNPVIWTLDVYIENICRAMEDTSRSAEENRKYLRRLGEEIDATYGRHGVQHAWRAAKLSKNEVLCDILQKEWIGLGGWKA